MRATKVLIKWVLVFVAGVVQAHASDPTAVYARIDKVVLEPNPDSPATIQVLGRVFPGKTQRPQRLSPAGSRLLVLQTTSNWRAIRRRRARSGPT